MAENRTERLSRDYYDMLRIQNRPYLSWIATKGELPYAEEYLLTVRIRSYALGVVSNRYTVGVSPQCTVRVTLWDSYPDVAPNIRMLNIPPVFHPSWYAKGTYCPSTPWRADSSLKDYLLGMLKTLLYDPEQMDFTAPANYKAMNWYLKNRENTALFPSDTVVLSENTDEELAALAHAALSFDEIIDSWDITR